jgi:hypothetical protein
MSACVIRSDPNRYLLARSRSPELIEPSDILEFTLDSQPVAPPTDFNYGDIAVPTLSYEIQLVKIWGKRFLRLIIIKQAIYRCFLEQGETENL